MEQAARPEPGTPRVYVDRKLRILYERAAGFETTRRYVLIRANRVEIEEQSTTSEICANPSPVATELSTLPEVSSHRSRKSKHRPLVEVRQQSRSQVSQRRLLSWHWPPRVRFTVVRHLTLAF